MSSRTLRSVMLAAAGLCTAAAAQAESIVFEFRGTLTASTYMAPVGSPIAGRFAWDTDAPRHLPHGPATPPSTQTSSGFYNGTDTLGIWAMVGGHTIVSHNLGVTVNDNTGGNVGDMVDINGYSPVVDGTTYTDGYLSIRLASQPDDVTALVGTDLPRELPLGRFNSSVNYAELRTDGSPTGLVLAFDMHSLERVPKGWLMKPLR